MPVVMNKKFATQLLRINHEAARAIWPEPDDFTNDPVSRDFDRSEITLRIKGERGTR